MSPVEPPKPLPTGAVPSASAPDDQRSRLPTDEVPPLNVGGKFQWGNLPIWGKWLGGAVAAFLMAVWPIWQHLRIEKADADAKIAEDKAHAAAAIGMQAKQAAEGGYQVTKPYMESLEHRVSVLEAAAKRAQPAHGTARRPIPVIAPARPKPLPHDLNAAEAQIQKGAPPAAPVQVKPADAGP